MICEWDEQKNRLNLDKHGIDFDDAKAIFDGPIVERRDDRRDYGETRMIAYGIVQGRLLVVVYTTRRGRIRLISARKGNTRERKAYEAKIASS